MLLAMAPTMLLKDPARSKKAGPTRTSLFSDLRLFRTFAYPRYVAGLVVMGSMALTTADWVFKATVADNVDPGQMGAFFGAVYLALNGLSLTVQLLLVSRLVRRFGVVSSSLVLPVLLSGAGLGLLAGGGLWAAVALKTFDGTLKHTLHRTTLELLYVPMLERVRSRVKRVVDAVGHRGGQAIASGLILVILAAGGGIGQVLAAMLAFGMMWFVIGLGIRAPYIDVFRRTLSEATARPMLQIRALDMSSLETLLEALNSANDDEVLAAMEVLESDGKQHLIPALILYHPAEAVVLAALESFGRARRIDFIPVADRLLDSATPAIHAALVRVRSTVAPSRQFLEARLESFCSSTRTTAAVLLYSHGWSSKDDTQAALTAAIDSENTSPKLALARVATAAAMEGWRGDEVMAQALVRLAGSMDHEVRVEVIQAMTAFRNDAYLDHIVYALADRATRATASESFRAIGLMCLPRLQQMLGSPGVPVRVRIELPRIMASMGESAAKVLLDRLPEEENGSVRYRMLRALEVAQLRYPSLRLPRQQLTAAVSRNLAEAFHFLHWRMTLDTEAKADSGWQTAAHPLLLQLLQDKEAQAIERVVRMEGLRHPAEDFRKVVQGLSAGSPAARSSSLELIETFADQEVRGPLLGLLAAEGDQQRLLSAPFEMQPLDYDGVLERMTSSGSHSLHAIATAQRARVANREGGLP
jgi:ATP:ADP antiporter, AAA family